MRANRVTLHCIRKSGGESGGRERLTLVLCFVLVFGLPTRRCRGFRLPYLAWWMCPTAGSVWNGTSRVGGYARGKQIYPEMND